MVIGNILQRNATSLCPDRDALLTVTQAARRRCDHFYLKPST
jgi:hypothetical protein